MSPEARGFLFDIAEACQRVTEWSMGRSRHELFADRRTLSAIERQLMIIGEAVKRVPPSTRSLAEDIPWGQIARFRDILVHNYGGLDQDALWRVISVNVPSLASEVARLLEDEQAR